jgi:hypothetical protein
MSVMSEVAYDIEQLYIEGEHPTSIARNLGIPLSMVYDWLESANVNEADEACYTMDCDPFSTINS